MLIRLKRVCIQQEPVITPVLAVVADLLARLLRRLRLELDYSLDDLRRLQLRMVLNLLRQPGADAAYLQVAVLDLALLSLRYGQRLLLAVVYTPIANVRLIFTSLP